MAVWKSYYPQPQVEHPQRVPNKHRPPADAMTLVHEKFEAKGMELTGKKASVLEIMGLAGHLGHVCFNFYFYESQPVG